VISGCSGRHPIALLHAAVKPLPFRLTVSTPM